jgi:UDP-N-acetylmuramoyl-tripeptide--D-alanyl-D-alanine ligase
VTGSAGKTTTKEAVAQVLGARFKVLKSQGNLNNGFGLPLQLLKLEREHEVAVIEMGMNHAGEIAALAKIAEPNWAVVSNVGPVHLEFFPDGIAGIARAKYELIEALPADGLAVLNFDDNYVASFGRGLGERAVFYGLGEGAEVRAVHVAENGVDGVRFIVEAHGERANVQLRMLGRHNIPNALAAIAVGLWSGMTLGECAAAVGEMRAGDKRGEVMEWRGATFINDCYNSNPSALDAMVDALMAIPGERHIVMAGEMLELGAEGEALHVACGRRMAERGVTKVVGVRGLAESMVKAARECGVDAIFLADSEAAGKWLEANVRAGDVVLLKASRGVRLERSLASLVF